MKDIIDRRLMGEEISDAEKNDLIEARISHGEQRTAAIKQQAVDEYNAGQAMASPDSSKRGPKEKKALAVEEFMRRDIADGMNIRELTQEALAARYTEALGFAVGRDVVRRVKMKILKQ